MTQHDRILSFLKKAGHTGLTSMSAIQHIGVINLPGRVSELRSKGYKIKQEPIDVTNRYGERVRVNRYWLGSRR